MSYTIGVVAFSVGLLLSVMLHEAGHFTTAKAYGMKASRFFVGFGPTLWSFRRGETEYGIKALPFGGFVKLDGMTSIEEIAPEDEPRAFYKQPAGKRTVVLAAGSVVHFIITIVLLFGVLAATGQDPIRTAGVQIAQVEKCLTPAADGSCAGAPTSPAYGVLQAGDVLLSVNGTKVTGSGDNFANILHKSAGTPATIVYERDGQTHTTTLTPQPTKVGKINEGRIGVETELRAAHVSVGGAFGRTFTLMGSFISSTGHAITAIPHEVHQVFAGQQRGGNEPASIVDVARVSGQISSSGGGIGDIVASLLLILAELNLFVGLFNLLPLLPLDGGHIAIIGFEKARTGIYRVIGRRDPGRVDIMKVLPLTYAVVAAFVGLSVILLYAGITNPIRLQ
ncbi:MAG TPA: site-2 protease family protein [Mycobacteriales bacterium]|jgi:membrane-associated protease RseP (regulator of RpoE activity)|nr:site-2 protease family protein [Mycobacteriales bacterium]